MGASATVADFWSWALSDLRANTVRSLLAEYLVARALGVADRPRVEWDSCDVRIPEGRIEVKAAAYVQAWAQRGLSKITFSGLKARTWTPEAGYSADPGYNADAYVFAVLAATEHEHYDPLDAAGWQFWVLPQSVLASTRQRSIGLTRVRALGGAPAQYGELASVIRAALGNQPRPGSPSD